MKKILLSVALVLLVATGLFAFSGTITHDTTWSGTVTLTGDVVVNNGILTIAPGSLIKAVKTSLSDSTNNLAGDGRVGIRVTGPGAIRAIGTQQNLITFTSAEAVPAKGDWWGIELLYLTKDSLSQFQYCCLLYGFRAFTVGSQEQSWGDTLSWQQPSNLTIDNCLMAHIQKDVIFISCDGKLSVDHSVIYDAVMGIFLRGTVTNQIKNTSIAQTSCGINLVCDKPNSTTHATSVTIDHLTLYNTDMLLTNNPLWWTGYGIYCTVNAGVGTLNLTNSVLVQASLANLSIDDRAIWTVTRDYNCWSVGATGLQNIERGTPSVHDTVADPMFLDPDNADFSLDNSSPCVSTASDGQNRGAWQSGALWWHDVLFPSTGMAALVPESGNTRPAITVGNLVSREQDVVMQVARDQELAITFFDVQGKELGKLARAYYAAGTYRVPVATASQAGIFFIQCRGALDTGVFKVTVLP